MLSAHFSFTSFSSIFLYISCKICNWYFHVPAPHVCLHLHHSIHSCSEHPALPGLPFFLSIPYSHNPCGSLKAAGENLTSAQLPQYPLPTPVRTADRPPPGAGCLPALTRAVRNLTVYMPLPDLPVVACLYLQGHPLQFHQKKSCFFTCTFVFLLCSRNFYHIFPKQPENSTLFQCFTFNTTAELPSSSLAFNTASVSVGA